MGNDSDEILSRVSHLEDGDSSRDIYDDWSGNYDNHLLDDFGYISPEIAAQALSDEIDAPRVAIIDYGCGTGLVGQALNQQGFTTVDGIDISQGMLDEARKSISRGPEAAHAPAWTMILAVLLQIVLGVATLITFVPLTLALMHQAGAFALLAVAVWHLHSTAAPSRR